eukprot:2284789-Alexandrium_andersonii.AAC.1
MLVARCLGPSCLSKHGPGPTVHRTGGPLSVYGASLVQSRISLTWGARVLIQAQVRVSREHEPDAPERQ